MNRARKRLLSMGLTQAAVAAILGVSTQLVGFWWAGRRVPSDARKREIQEKLGIPASDWRV